MSESSRGAREPHALNFVRWLITIVVIVAVAVTLGLWSGLAFGQPNTGPNWPFGAPAADTQRKLEYDGQGDHKAINLKLMSGTPTPGPKDGRCSIVCAGATPALQASIDGGAYAAIGSGGGGGSCDCPGAGTDSSRVGVNATAVGDNSVVVGVDADATGLQSVAVGYNATVDAGADEGIAIGLNTNTVSDRGVAVGGSSGATTDAVVVGGHSLAAAGAVVVGAACDASGSNTVAIGFDADIPIGAPESIGIGHGAQIDGTASIGIGRAATVSAAADQAIVIGDGAATIGIGSVLIGEGATGLAARGVGIGQAASPGAGICVGAGCTSDANTAVIGSSSQIITNVYFGEGQSDLTPSDITIHGTAASGANTAGGATTVAGGAGTGTGTGGPVKVSHCPAGTTGSVENDCGTVFQSTTDNVFHVWPDGATLTGELVGTTILASALVLDNAESTFFGYASIADVTFMQDTGGAFMFVDFTNYHNPSGVNRNWNDFLFLNHEITLECQGGATCTADTIKSFESNPQLKATGGSTMTVNRIRGLELGGTVDTGVTLTDREGVRCVSMDGSGTISDDNYCVEIQRQTMRGDYTRGISNADTTIWPPLAQNITSVGDTIVANSTLVELANDTVLPITLVSAPTIADPGNTSTGDGQCVKLMSVGAQPVELQDEGTLPNSNLRLNGATNQTLGQGDSLWVCFNATLGAWFQDGQTADN